jgi:hypothetical protein
VPITNNNRDQGHILVAEVARRTLSSSGDVGTSALAGIEATLAADRDYFPYHSHLPLVPITHYHTTCLSQYNIHLCCNV